MRTVLLLVLNCSLLAAEKPLLHALVASGWNEKPTVEFTVTPDRKFVWRSGQVARKGTVEAGALAELVAHIRATKPGPVANDVGTLQVTWREHSGKTSSKVFYFPGNMPASGLVQEMEAIAARYGKLDEAGRKP